MQKIRRFDDCFACRFISETGVFLHVFANIYLHLSDKKSIIILFGTYGGDAGDMDTYKNWRWKT